MARIRHLQRINFRTEQQAFVKAFLLDEDLESEISMDELIDFLSYLFLYWAIVLVYEVRINFKKLIF